MLLSLFQTPTGTPHVSSILMISGWFLSSLVALMFILANLRVNRDERNKAFQKEQESQVASQATKSTLDSTQKELKDARVEITELKKKTTQKPFDVRLRSLLNEIDPRILKRLEDGETGFLTVNVPQELHRTLLRLYKEKGSDKYITIDRSVHDGKPLIGIGIPSGTYVVTKIKLSPNLIPLVSQR